MKILQVINSLTIGGAEKLVLDTVPLYIENGIKMDVMLLWDNDCMFAQQLKDLECCKIHIVKKSTNFKNMYNPFLIFKIAKIIKHYDIAHVHLFPAQYFVVLANLINKNKTKLIFTEHSTSNRRVASAFLSIIDCYFYKSYKKIIAISDGVCAVLTKHLKTTNKIEVIVNGVNLKQVYLAPKSIEISNRFTNKKAKLLLQVGGLRTEKDQDTTIRSLLHLPEDYSLLLIGDGERKKQLIELVNQKGLEKRVHFLGMRNDVFSIIKCVDVVVVSSHWEGFGLAAIEGMAANKPVVASNVLGLSDVVKGAGILFEVKNEKELAQKIRHLLDDNQHYKNVANLCFERAKEYNIEEMINKHIALYKTVYKS